MNEAFRRNEEPLLLPEEEVDGTLRIGKSCRKALDASRVSQKPTGENVQFPKI
jgi:hypothetical protein